MVGNAMRLTTEGVMITFSDILQWYIAHLGTRPSAAKYNQVFRQFFQHGPLAQLPADAVTKWDVQQFKQAHEQTPAQCKKAMQLICQAYNWASVTADANTRTPLYTGHNPGLGVKKPSMKSRERLMDKSEIRLMLDSLDFLSLKYQAFFLTRLLTPCRIKELCEMRRADVDLTTGKWHKRYTKNGRQQYTLIPTQALEFLRALPVQGDYFFMGNYGKPLQRESARKIWSVFREDLKMPDVQLLDFRRTLASYLYTEVKADDLTAKAVLNHYDGRPVAVYTRLAYDRLAAIIQQYADWVWSLRTQSASPLACGGKLNQNRISSANLAASESCISSITPRSLSLALLSSVKASKS